MIDDKLDKILIIDIGTAEYSNINISIVGTTIYMSPEVFAIYDSETYINDMLTK
jgi:hypothetical protein